MSDLGCPPNAAIVFDYLIGKGLLDFQAAAVVGNLQWESGIDPTKSVMDINGLPSRGIAMWQPARWQNLLTFATGRDPLSLGVQLEFLWYELQSFGLGQLLESQRIEDAVVIFQDRFEKPKAELAHTANRIALAKAALYACPTVSPPIIPPKRGGAIAVTVGVLALVVATGYGAYKMLSARTPKPQLPPPRPEPIRRLPPLRPRPTPPWGPG